MRHTSRLTLPFLLLFLTVCGQPKGDGLAAFSGTWSVTAFGEGGDSLTSYTLTAGADPSAWTMTFPGMAPVALHVVSTAGDSVVVRTDSYPSVLEPDVHVTSEAVMKVQGDQISGTFLSHRTVMGPDSVLRGTARGARRE